MKATKEFRKTKTPVENFAEHFYFDGQYEVIASDYVKAFYTYDHHTDGELFLEELTNGKFGFWYDGEENIFDSLEEAEDYMYEHGA